jgi:hypothetical protein
MRLLVFVAVFVNWLAWPEWVAWYRNRKST